MVVPTAPYASNDRAGADGLSTKLNRIFPAGSGFSSGISGRFATEYVIDPVNCDGHWIAAGKRQFERLVEKGINPMVFLPFRVGARGLRV